MEGWGPDHAQIIKKRNYIIRAKKFFIPCLSKKRWTQKVWVHLLP